MPTLTVKIDDDIRQAIDELKNDEKISDVLREALNLWIQAKTGHHNAPTVVEFPIFQIKDALETQPAPRHIRMKVTYTTLFESLHKQWVQALRTGTHIQVLMLDERSVFAGIRNQDLELPEGTVLKRLQDTLKDIRSIVKEAGDTKGSLEVRTYDRIPYFPFYILDNVAFTGYYITLKSGHLTNYIRFAHLDYPYISDIVTEFNRLWATSRKNAF